MQPRVVCIEDEPEMIELMNLILERQGFKFIAARGGAQGLEMVKEIKPDLVLLDIMMPEVDGWMVYDQLRANPETKHIPVLIVTARAPHDPRLTQMRLANAHNLVTKPFSPTQLIEAIERVLPKNSA
jgi:CheY-like chemotaxis protein